MAGSVGLLHGFGFAAVLRDVSLPERGFAEALLAFNLGIEAGQIVFASLFLAVLAHLHRLPAQTKVAHWFPGSADMRSESSPQTG